MFQILLPEGGEGARLFFMEMLPSFIETVPLGSPLVKDGRELIFLPEGEGLPEGFLPSKGATVIASSESESQLAGLSQLPVQVLACGLSSKDTVTFSSRSEGRAAVSLLREIKGWDGRPVEPMEFLLDVPEGCGDYLVLAAAAAAVYFEISPYHLKKISSYKKVRPAHNTNANAKNQIFKRNC